MKHWILLVLFLSACQESPQHSLERPSEDAPAIAGGTTVPFTNPLTSKALQITAVYNTQVKETEKGSETTWETFKCTGAAISPQIIITAAHCLKEPADRYTISVPVIAGEFIEIEADTFSIHEDYASKDVDLALLHVPNPLPREVQILKLPQQNQNLNLTAIIAAGYGNTKDTPTHKKDSGILRTTKLNVVNYKAIDSVFIVDQTKGRGICRGDSGGPGMLELAGDTYLVGVAEAVLYPHDVSPDYDKCSDQGKYINVQYHLPWIKKTSAMLMRD